MPTNVSRGKKYTYIWVSLIILIFGFITVPRIVNALKEGAVVEEDRLSSTPLDYITLNGEKRKVPQFQFLNQDSIQISNEDYLGKVYLVDFFFTSCPTICPVMTKNLVEIQNTFSEKAPLGFASFTINPRYDTPVVLKRYKTGNGATNPNWNFLTGSQNAIYDLATKGFHVVISENEEVPGGFEHSGLFALIDKKGFLRSRKDKHGNPKIYYKGSTTKSERAKIGPEEDDIEMLKEDIKKLLAE